LAEPPQPEPPGVLISRQLAEARALATGDVVRFAADPAGRDALSLRIAGIHEPVPDPFRLTEKRYEARLHLPDLIELVAAKDPLARESVTRISVRLADPAAAGSFARELQSRLPGIQAHPTSASDDRSNPFVVLERFHVAIAWVTVIGAAAFLLALMVMRSDERREMAGILRLIGFRRSRILLEVFAESLLVALAGTIFGVLLAFAIQGAVNRFFQWHYDTALVFIRVTPLIAAKCVALSVPLGVLAGIAASWTLLRRNIMHLLRR